MCLALSLLGTGLKAQISTSSEYVLRNNPQVFSPNAAEFGKYGKIPVSYFNGLPNISIPLTELKAKGYTLPIYLSYHASGNKPDQHPGWVGLGWSLHAGGCINRIVNGMKDEMTVGEYGETHNNVPPHDPGYYHHRAFVQQSDWTDGQVVTDALNELHTCDPDPDEFQVCLDEIQASFYLTENGGIRIVSKSPADFKVDIHLAEDGEHNPILIYPGPLESQGFGAAVRYDYFDQITLTNSDGTIYVFGGNDDAVEYSMPLIPVYNEYGITNEWKCLANANTWFLTRIERPNGEIITFTYTKDGTPIVRQDVHHSEFCHYDEAPLLEYSFNTRDNPNQLDNISFSLIQPSYLTSIHCRYSADSLFFSRTQTTELEYATSSVEFEKRAGQYTLTMNNVTYYSYSQMKAEDYYMQLAGISGPDRDMRLSYSSDPSRRLTLQQVSFRSGNDSADHRYTFEYDSEPLPPYHARQSDLWGFYNGINYSTTHYKALEQARKQVNPAKTKAEILRIIHYPSGGWTEFDYEGHDYSKEITQVDISLADLNQTSAAGGLRIKEIRDYSSSGKPETRSFSYLSQTGLSSGILAGTPTLFASGEVSRTLSMTGFSFSNGTTWTENGFYELFSEYPIRPLSTTDGNHVTYSRVKETLPDGSCSVYQYTNHDEPLCCDTRPVWRISYTNSHILFNTFNSRELFRGLLLHRVDSSANGTVIRDELNEYVIDTTQFIKSISIETECNQFIRRDSYRKIPSAFPYLKKKTVKMFPDDGGSPHTEITEYAYDSHRRLTETKRTAGRVRERETFSYTGNYSAPPYAGMRAKNMISYPVEHLKFRKDTLQSEKLISAELTTWREGAGGRHVPSAQYTADLGAGLLPANFTPYSTGNDSLASYPNPMVTYTRTDSLENILESVSRDSLYSSYLWDKAGVHPEMIAKNARNSFRKHTVTINHSTDGLIDYDQVPDPTVPVATLVTSYPGTLTLDIGSVDGQDWGVTLSITGAGTVMLGSHGISGNAFNALTDYRNTPSRAVIPLPVGSYPVYLVDVQHFFEGGDVQDEAPELTYEIAWTTETLSTVGYDDVFHEDFEPETVQPGASQAGFHSYGYHTGGNYTFDLFTDPDRRYILDYRIKQNNGAWQYVRSNLTYSANGNHTIQVGTAKLDEVRVYPADSDVESYTWDKAGNLLSRTDSRGVTESYRYDGLGRLVGIYDNEGKKVEGYQYNYQNR